MNINDEFTLKITGITFDGAGVGRKDGMVVFVPGAIDGETVRVRVKELKKSYATAGTTEITEESPYRREPFCPDYARCGGCGLQHMSYEHQLELKRGAVTDSLERIGGFKGVRVNPVIGMDEPFYYRNKARYPVGESRGKTVSGFYAGNSHEIIDIDNCLIQDPASERIRKAVTNAIEEYEISGISHIVTRVSGSTGDVMLILESDMKNIPRIDKLVTRITAGIPEIKSIVLNVKSTDKTITLFGDDSLKDTLSKLEFRVPPLSFFQVNHTQTAVLYEKAVEFAGLTGCETVFDLYCGIGSITLFLAARAKKAIGVEVFKEAVDAARQNALINNITNVEFYAGRAEDVIPRLYEKGEKADVVVADPPRKGCDKALLETIIKIRPARIVYVSCNPSTLARDLKTLCETEYSIREVQPVDMFPWTEHVETVVMMSRAK